MTTRRTKTSVLYTAAQMFDLVADVERYPEFIPFCVALRVLGADGEVGDAGQGTMTAEMIVAYGALRERFKSAVRLDRERMTIRADYLDGPFRTLHTTWRFTEAPDGSAIDFSIEFEFKNFLLQGVAAAMFEKVFARMSDAFVARAHDVYGAAR